MTQRAERPRVDRVRNLIGLRRAVVSRKGRLIVNTVKSGKQRTIGVPTLVVGRRRDLWSICQAADSGRDGSTLLRGQRELHPCS